MLRQHDELYSAADYHPITDEHFLRRCSAPVEDVQEDNEQDFDDWQDIQDMLH